MGDHMQCPAKHTMYQPEDAEFRCPRCGASPDDEKPFVVEEPVDGSADDCSLLHEKDGCYCYACDYSCSGRTLAKKIATAKDLVPCPTCGGHGMVPRSKDAGQ